jgi:DnaK suppressor protein
LQLPFSYTLTAARLNYRFLAHYLFDVEGEQMPTTTMKRNCEFEMFRNVLEQRRRELVERLNQRHDEIAIEGGPEDEAALALRSVNRDLAIANMERETRTLSEIDLSLKRLEAGQYGICGSCDSVIPGARLRALPWTRLCIDCAGGGIRQSSAGQARDRLARSR